MIVTSHCDYPCPHTISTPASVQFTCRGNKHAGVRIVQEGPTLVHALDVHLRHSDPLTADVLLPYLHAKLPDSQHQAIARRKIGRRARSRTKRPILLAELEARYADSS